MADLNEKQREAIDRIVAGESIIIAGTPGSGKTTTVQELLIALLPITPITSFRDPSGSTKEQETKVGIACCASTNRATNNMYQSFKRNKPEVLQDAEAPIVAGNFLTIHKLLEYAPVYYWNEEKQKDSMKFEPKRDMYNKLPEGLIMVIEEASTIDVNFSNVLAEALIEGTIQLVILGDINQLAPVFGDSILNYALRKLPVIELTHVYRQALESPIIRQAHRILRGEPPVTDEATKDTAGVVMVHAIEKRMGDVAFGKRVADGTHQLHKAGKYDPQVDMVLTPYNVGGCGSIELNTLIAGWMDDDTFAIEEAACTPIEERHKIYEVLAGFTKAYYAIGDRVYDGISKAEGTILDIRKNGEYYGKLPQPASVNLSRTGTIRLSEGQHDEGAAAFAIDPNAQFDYSKLDLTKESIDTTEARIVAGSHIIEIQLEDGEIVTRGSAGEINTLTLGYCLTVHKAQGCEWPRVVMSIHHKHSQLFREGLYTGLTRAQKDCFILTDMSSTIDKVMNRQRIKGNTLEEKIRCFNEKLIWKEEQARLKGGQAAVDLLPKARLLDCIKKVKGKGDW